MPGPTRASLRATSTSPWSPTSTMRTATALTAITPPTARSSSRSSRRSGGRGPPSSFRSDAASECVLGQLHQIQRGGLGDLALDREPGQHGRDEEPRGGDLPRIEGTVGLAGRRATGPCLVQAGECDLSLAAQQPADDQVTECQQQPGGVQADPVDLVRLVQAGSEGPVQGITQGLDVISGPGQRRPLSLQAAVARIGGGKLPDLLEQEAQRLALVPDDLAEVQVRALDTRGALIQAVDLGISDVLLDRVVLQVAGSAQSLQGLRQQLVGALGSDSLVA